MLNPNAPGPSTAKKEAMQKRLNKTANHASENQAINISIDDYYKQLKEEKQANRAHDKQVSESVDKQMSHWPKYTPPKSPPLSTKKGPHSLFNPNAKIDSSQIQDRVQSEAMDHFISRLAEHKSQNFMEQYLSHHPYSNKSLPDTHSHADEEITGVQVKGKGTKNKEALLKRLREK